MKRSYEVRFSALAAFVAAMMVATSALADTPITSFTPGDLVVLRGGDATHSNNSAAPDASGEVPTYLDEYTPNGTYAGTITVPGLTLPGQTASSHEGGLNLSANGQFLIFGGYDTPAGATPHAVDGTENNVIARIGVTAASLNTSTIIAGAATPNSVTSKTGQFLRAVNSVDGNNFYVANKFLTSANGANVGTSTDGAGILYVTGVGSGATAQTLQPGVDWRSLVITNNTLYGGTGSSSVGTHGGYLIGTAGTLPTPANVTVAAASTTLTHTLLTNYSGGQSASNMALVQVATSDASAKNQNGLNVLYTVGDQSVAGITKYYFDGTTWQPANSQVALNATNVNNPTGLIAQIDPSNSAWVDLFVSGTNGIYSYIDKSGDPLTGLGANVFTPIATPLSSDYAFYGMAPAPKAVPEPSSLILAGAGAVGLLEGWRRRRQTVRQ
jgi:PEP-CTERM motif